MNDDKKSELVLSGASPIQVRFIGWLVVVCAGGFGGWIWWAASMSTKLDVVISNQSIQMAAIKAVVEDVSRLKEWRVQTEPTIRTIDDLRREASELRREFDIHRSAGKPIP